MTLREAAAKNTKLTKQYNELQSQYNILMQVVKFLMTASVYKFWKWKLSTKKSIKNETGSK